DRRVGGQAISSLSVLKLAEGRREISPYYVWGCNFSIRRKVLIDAGGFHPDSMPPDLVRFRGDGETHLADYVSKAGLNCVFDSEASVYHAVPQDRMTFTYFRARSFNQGVSDSFTSLRAGAAMPRRRSIQALAIQAARRLRTHLSALRHDSNFRE